ncbi:MAG: hydrolase family protein [Candidatus Saccharibacteria bacterium]|jgi:lysophospholipase L1-like esterase|nr:hydrolase family protein [Candidatus Saccharibacteria bacterium]
MRRRYIWSFIGAILFAGVAAGPMVFASAEVTGGVLQSATGTTTAVRTNTAQPAAVTTVRSAPPRQVQAGATYVAMGDSVAAGAGLPLLGNATAMDKQCDRSGQAYPYQVAQALQTTVVQLACSGAKVDEGIYGTQVRNGVRIPAQLPIAFSNGTPDLITVTIGANDMRWTQLIRQCYAVRCGYAADSVRTKIYRADLRIELTRMLNQINTRSAGNPPRVLVGGYYSVLDSTECLTANRITAAELAWLNEQTASLNQAIRSVVPLFNFATYVPVNFQGHGICSAEPWVQGLEAAAPAHPTSEGQAVIAQSFLTALGR